MTRQTTPFTNVTANLGRLNRRELEEVAALVGGERDARETPDAAATAATAAQTTPDLGNGCGPYAYLRFYSGKTHKSTYIGKVEAKE